MKTKYNIGQHHYSDKQNIVFDLGSITQIRIEGRNTYYVVHRGDNFTEYEEKYVITSSQKALKNILKRFRKEYLSKVEQARQDYIKDFTKTDIVT